MKHADEAERIRKKANKLKNIFYSALKKLEQLKF